MGTSPSKLTAFSHQPSAPASNHRVVPQSYALRCPSDTADRLRATGFRLLHSNGGFVPDFHGARSFIIKQIGGFVFQKNSQLSSISRQLQLSTTGLCHSLTPIARRIPPTAFRPVVSAFCPPTVASFLISTEPDPLLSSKSVASFFKKAPSFQPSAFGFGSLVVRNLPALPIGCRLPPFAFDSSSKDSLAYV